MLRSLYSGVAGLRTHQTKMDVIGNNIANANTTAFKSSRATFKDIYYQTMSPATAANEIKGGVNAKQIGYGSSVSTIDVINTRGGWQSTDRTLDLYIDGDGYFVVQDAIGNTSFTRVGNFNFDATGSLVDGNGNYISGWIPSYQENAAASIINIPNISNYTNITIGSDGTITGVYSADDQEHIPNTYEPMATLEDLGITNYSTFKDGIIYGTDAVGATIELYKNIKINDDGTITADNAQTGAAQELLGNVADYTNTPEDYSGWAITTDGSIAGLYRGHFTNTIEDFGSLNGPTLANAFAGYTDVKFTNGSITGIDANGAVTTLYTNVIINENAEITGTNAITGAQGEAIPGIDIANYINNIANYDNFTIDTEGNISGTYIADQYPIHVPGEVETLGQIAVATFANPDGLTQISGVYFQESANSGDPIITYPGEASTGSIVSGGLEASNVDLSKEFTDMITTQRGFQASSRIITVSDSMLEELVNLKR